MIDVLLVIIIFLMLTTTYAKFSGLEINLPTAEASKQPKTQRNRRSRDGYRPSPGHKSPLAASDVKSIAESCAGPLATGAIRLW